MRSEKLLGCLETVFGTDLKIAIFDGNFDLHRCIIRIFHFSNPHAIQLKTSL